jgi:Fe-S oxidoreductase
MWLEENISTRIYTDRVDEALATGAGVVAVACPYGKIMLDDGAKTRGREYVSVLDIAQLLEQSFDSGDLARSAACVLSRCPAELGRF